MRKSGGEERESSAELHARFINLDLCHHLISTIMDDVANIVLLLAALLCVAVQ